MKAAKKALVVVVALSALVLAGCTLAPGAAETPGARDPNPVPAKSWEVCMQQYGELSQEVIFSGRELPAEAQDWTLRISESTRLRGYGEIAEATTVACEVVAEQQEWLSAGS